jgi:hypothetical protein
MTTTEFDMGRHIGSIEERLLIIEKKLDTLKKSIEFLLDRSDAYREHIERLEQKAGIQLDEDENECIEQECDACKLEAEVKSAMIFS